MATAFVLINSNLGSEKEILAKLKGIEDVKEAYLVYGMYDIMVKLEAESAEKLKGVLEERVHGLENVRSILTMIAVE